MACSLASVRAPTAIVTDSTAGSATGTAATVTTSANSRVVAAGAPRARLTATINVTSTAASRMRKFPIRSTARWKWLTVDAVATRRVVCPK